jgi:FtsH-binding integral membrane protein
MISNIRIASLTAFGVATMCLFTWGLKVVEAALNSHGYNVHPLLFMLVLFGGLFACFAFVAKLVNRAPGKKAGCPPAKE